MDPRKTLVEKLFLTHRTDFCPVPEMKIGGTFLSNLTTGERYVSKDPYRGTLHWSFADINPNVGISNRKIEHEKIWKNKGPQYILIESIEALKNDIIGGWLDDLYMMGPHTPSEQSILIVPDDEVDALKKQGFSGKILSYHAARETSEEIFKKFVSNYLEDFNLKISFPKTSHLSRIASQFGNEIADILKNNPDGIAIDADFIFENGQRSPIHFEKTDLQYHLITNKSGIDICLALSIQSACSLVAEPGEISIYFMQSGLEFSLKQLFTNMSWISISHDISPFGCLEKAILTKDMKKIDAHLKEIESRLNFMSSPYKKYMHFRKTLVKSYGLELNHCSKENINLSMNFLSTMNKKQESQPPSAAVVDLKNNDAEIKLPSHSRW